MKTATSRWFQNQQQSCGCENIQQLETTRISHLHASTTFMLLLLKDGWNSLKILWPSVKGHYSITKQDHACIRPSCSHLHAPLNRMLHKAAAIIRKITLKFWLIKLRKQHYFHKSTDCIVVIECIHVPGSGINARFIIVHYPEFAKIYQTYFSSYSQSSNKIIRKIVLKLWLITLRQHLNTP